MSIRREAQQGQPVGSAQVDARHLVGTVTLARATLELVQIEPQGKQVQEELAADPVRTLAASIQIRTQDAIDGFGGTAGRRDTVRSSSVNRSSAKRRAAGSSATNSAMS